jgi:hypothetical protein
MLLLKNFNYFHKHYRQLYIEFYCLTTDYLSRIREGKKKVDCPETVRWFLQRIWKFLFWTVWTLDVFGLRSMRCVRFNQLSATKIYLHFMQRKSKTSTSCAYGFYGCNRKGLILS